MIATASPWKPLVQQDRAAADDSWASEGMDTFLTSDDVDIPYLVPDVLARSCLMQIFAPRGIGKSVLAAYWAASLVSSGKRVLMLDRDNPRYMVSGRLHSLGADDLAEQRSNLRAISRERCPKLTENESGPASFIATLTSWWWMHGTRWPRAWANRIHRSLPALWLRCLMSAATRMVLPSCYSATQLNQPSTAGGPASSKTGRTSCTRCGTPRDSVLLAASLGSRNCPRRGRATGRHAVPDVKAAAPAG